MRVVFISDTHNRHDLISVPDGDMIVHSGDFSSRGEPGEIAYFLKWYADLPHRHKVLIAGNHDFLAETAPSIFRGMIPDSVVYLEDSGVEIEGLRIWGSPIQPWFFDWAFNRKRGAEIKLHWDLIPDDTDLLITHGPPYGILDKVVRDGSPVGCRDLLAKAQLVRPRVHVFGHIHEGYGQLEIDGVNYLNASVLDERYAVKNAPIVFDF